MRLQNNQVETYVHQQRKYLLARNYQREAFLQYIKYIYQKPNKRTPFFSTVKYVVLFISTEKKKIIVKHKKTKDVFYEHVKAMGKNAIFQAASQFNYLEMISPMYRPSNGITNYVNDNSQGPKCALATPGATLYRNWALTSDIHQLNGLKNIMKYCQGLSFQNGYIHYDGTPFEIAQENVNQLLQIAVTTAGVMLNQIPLNIQNKHITKCNSSDFLVSNAWCSAISLGYLPQNVKYSPYIQKFAEQILYATYLLTLRMAAFHPNINTVYLTFVGGGFFENKYEWILNAMLSAIKSIQYMPLKVIILHYKTIDSNVTRFFFKCKCIIES